MTERKSKPSTSNYHAVKIFTMDNLTTIVASGHPGSHGSWEPVAVNELRQLSQVTQPVKMIHDPKEIREISSKYKAQIQRNEAYVLYGTVAGPLCEISTPLFNISC